MSRGPICPLRGSVSFVATLAMCLLGAFLPQAGAAQSLQKVRLGGDSAQTRIVIELDRAVKGQVLSDSRDLRTVILALPGVHPETTLNGKGRGLIADWSVEDVAGASRVKLRLAADAVIGRRFLLPPGDGVPNYRYVIDLYSQAYAASQASDQTASVSGVLPDRAGAISTKLSSVRPGQDVVQVLDTPEPRKRSGKRIVVIDAGHGGKDPGTLGADSPEKDVTLSAARTLKAKLERTGRFTVVMTRETDAFIALDSRVRIARQANADLFISLHADAAADPNTRGASIYTLSDTGSERAARKVMTRGDWTVPAINHANSNDRVVNRILLDLTQRVTKNRSATFAQILLNNIDDHTPLLRRSHRQAGFAVLLAPDVPAVLLEMGFMSNREDEKALSDPAYRDRLMQSTADAINAYFSDDVRFAGFGVRP
ncbi:MAG: N-acetylmuramoyl-L-alanine amidase [Asticcacaulis sp.]